MIKRHQTPVYLCPHALMSDIGMNAVREINGCGASGEIVDGPFKELDGKVGEVDESRGKVKVLVAMFGRETPVELDFLQVKRI